MPGAKRSSSTRSCKTRRSRSTASASPRRRRKWKRNARRFSLRDRREPTRCRPAAGRTSTRPSTRCLRSSRVRCMLRPERMTRTLIVGPREKLASTIEPPHVTDHHAETEPFRIGKPLSKASELSESLVKVRSIMNILAVKEPPKETEQVKLEALRQKILTLELNISEEEGTRKKIEGLLSDLTRRVEELRPFATLGLPLDIYRGYDSIAALVGRIPRARGAPPRR